MLIAIEPLWYRIFSHVCAEKTLPRVIRELLYVPFKCYEHAMMFLSGGGSFSVLP